MILIYTVFKDKDEAQKIAKQLLEKKMVSCVNFWEIESLYWWEEKLVEGHEVVAIFKTLKQNFRAVKNEIKKNHSYKVPFIASIKLNEVDGDFYAYLKKTVFRYYGPKSPSAKINYKNPDLRNKP